MTIINWGTSALAFAGDQRVYVRQRWADAWVLQPNIWCSNLTWGLLPSIGVANLSLEYGHVLPHGSLVYGTQAKLDLAGWYVRVEVDAADGMLSWHGFIDEIADEQGGITAGVPSGTLQWVAYGMEQILAHAFLLWSIWYDEPAGTLRWSGSAIDFNDDGKPNRSTNMPAGATSHVFVPRIPSKLPGTGSKPWSDNTYWSTRDILLYLMQYANPRDKNNEVKVPFALASENNLPDWDKPTVQAEGRSALDIISELANPSRLVQIATTVVNNVVVLEVHSLANAEISLEGGKKHPANPLELSLVTWAAQDTQVSVQESLSRQAAQVVARGSKRQSLITGQVAISRTPEKPLIEGFDDFQKLEYDQAASAETGYSSLDDDKKKEANQRARATASLADVYRTFAINPGWTFRVGGEPVFPDEVNAVGGSPAQYYPYFGSIKIKDKLPIKENFDYDSAVPITTVPFPILAFQDQSLTEHRRPFVLFERPTEKKYIDAEKMANGKDPKFSCHTALVKEDHAIALDATGAYQHAIAYSRFTPLPVDEKNGKWDYVDSYFTIALEEDRHLQSFFPKPADVPDVDVVRRRIVYGGESYERVVVVADVVYDVKKEDGSLRKLNGGSPVPHFRNDQAALDSLVQLVAHWTMTPRRVLRLVTARPTAMARVGQMVTTLNADTPHATTINTVVSEIQLAMRRGANLPLAAAEFSLTTAAGELDALAFFPRQKRLTT